MTPIAASLLPLTRKPPSDTSTSHSWHSTLTSPAKTWQISPYPGSGIYETMHWRSRDLPDKKLCFGQGGEASPLIYLQVETWWISPIHFPAMPLLWQPVCKYLLTLTRTKQCHCTSRWFRFRMCVCVRRWDIHGAVVCIPGSRLLRACESLCTDEFCWCWSVVNVLLGERESMSDTNRS